MSVIPLKLNYFALSGLLICITSSTLIIILLILGRNKLQKIWTLYNFAIAFWGYGIYLAGSSASPAEAAIGWKIALGGGYFISIVFFNVVNIYCDLKKTKLAFLFYLLSAIYLAVLFTNNLGYKIVYAFNSLYYASPTHLTIFHFFGLIWFISATYGHYLLFRFYRTATGETRKQALYFFIASVVGFSGGSTYFLYPFGINIYPYGQPLIVFHTIIFTYAILRHKLLDIPLVIKKSVLYSILISLITAIYLVLVLLTERFLYRFIGYSSLITSVLAAFTIALIFTPLKNTIQSFIDKYFFKGTVSSLAEEKEHLEEELRRSDRLKAVATLAAGMAHEIKNPLTGIKTFTEYLDKNKDNPEFIDKFKKIVGSEVDKINNIVHQLLDFAKPSPLTLKECDIQQILDETLSLLSSDLLKHNIILEKEPKAENAKIMADFNQLKQAFLNIFLNSIQAMPNGGSLKIGISLYSDKVQVIIRDTGIGIAEKDLHHIFDPFYTTTDEGTGLGLSITHGIIKEHNGRIDVESKVHVGTKFIISFPLAVQL